MRLAMKAHHLLPLLLLDFRVAFRLLALILDFILAHLEVFLVLEARPDKIRHGDDHHRSQSVQRHPEAHAQHVRAKSRRVLVIERQKILHLAPDERIGHKPDHGCEQRALSQADEGLWREKYPLQPADDVQELEFRLENLCRPQLANLNAQTRICPQGQRQHDRQHHDRGFLHGQGEHGVGAFLRDRHGGHVGEEIAEYPGNMLDNDRKIQIHAQQAHDDGDRLGHLLRFGDIAFPSGLVAPLGCRPLCFAGILHESPSRIILPLNVSAEHTPVYRSAAFTPSPSVLPFPHALRAAPPKIGEYLQSKNSDAA